MRSRSDVIVVGAGLSGLAAATKLVDAGVESVVVMEAGSRVGGRTLNGTAGGTTIDEGATLVYPNHNHVLRLAERSGVDVFESGAQGQFVYSYDGVARSFGLGRLRGVKLLTARWLRPVLRGGLALLSRWTELPMSSADIMGVLSALRQLDDLAAAVPAAEPWLAPGADELDRRSIGAWLDEVAVTPQARHFFESLFGYFPQSTSLLFALHFLKTWGGIGSLMTGQASVYRFVDGAQALALALADSLGERVVLECPVTAIDRSSDGVTVHAGGAVYEADHVIVALSPAGCRDIEFRPELPAGRVCLQEAWQPVHGLKVNAVYREPFWRSAGLSGSALTDSDAAPGILDASPADGSVGVLACYATDDGVSGSRREAVLAAYAEAFGLEALHPQHYSEKRWKTEPFHHGCEGGLVVGALTSARTLLKTPVGRVHWAGVETADEWMGFMNGAVQAGQRAGVEVVGGLGVR